MPNDLKGFPIDTYMYLKSIHLMNFLLQGGVENLTLLKLICYLQKLVKIGLVVSEKFETFSCKLTMYIHIQ